MNGVHLPVGLSVYGGSRTGKKKFYRLTYVEETCGTKKKTFRWSLCRPHNPYNIGESIKDGRVNSEGSLSHSRLCLRWLRLPDLQQIKGE